MNYGPALGAILAASQAFLPSGGSTILCTSAKTIFISSLS